jgi:hypothetical protein
MPTIDKAKKLKGLAHAKNIDPAQHGENSSYRTYSALKHDKI